MNKFTHVTVSVAYQCVWCAKRHVSHIHLLQFPRASYGGRHTVTLLPGDGVGPELMSHVKEVFRYNLNQESHHI